MTNNRIKAKMAVKKALVGRLQRATGGTAFYEQLVGKPQINGVELTGNKLSADLLLQDMMRPVKNTEIDNLFIESEDKV